MPFLCRYAEQVIQDGRMGVGRGLPTKSGDIGDLYLDIESNAVFKYTEQGWRAIKDNDKAPESNAHYERPRTTLTESDEDFLRALLADPQRVPMYLKHGDELTNDRGKVLLSLNGRQYGKRAWEQMYDKIASLFCAVCGERAEGFCQECRRKLTDDLQRIHRETR